MSRLLRSSRIMLLSLPLKFHDFKDLNLTDSWGCVKSVRKVYAAGSSVTVSRHSRGLVRQLKSRISEVQH